jgi:hypothetical protein
MSEPRSSPPMAASVIMVIVGTLALIALIMYLARAGGMIGGEQAVKAALLALQKAQTEFRRIDRDGDGYLEYTLDLRMLGQADGLIAPALAAACGDNATEDVYGYRFFALKGVMINGQPAPFALAPDGNGTLDGFAIAARPAREGLRRTFYIGQTGDAWLVERAEGNEEYLPERR